LRSCACAMRRVTSSLQPKMNGLTNNG
jgi:hypothetical protein